MFSNIADSTRSNFHQIAIQIPNAPARAAALCSLARLSERYETFGPKSLGFFSRQDGEEIERHVVDLTDEDVVNTPFKNVEELKSICLQLLGKLKNQECYHPKYTLEEYLNLSDEEEQKWIVRSGSLAYLKGLIRDHCHTFRTKEGEGLVHVICKKESHYYNHLLITCFEMGVSPNQPSTSGMLPLHYALQSKQGADVVFRSLVKHGADPFLKPEAHKSPYECILQDNQEFSNQSQSLFLLAIELARKRFETQWDYKHDEIDSLAKLANANSFSTGGAEFVALLESIRIRQPDSRWLESIYEKLTLYIFGESYYHFLKEIVLWLLEKKIEHSDLKLQGLQLTLFKVFFECLYELHRKGPIFDEKVPEKILPVLKRTLLMFPGLTLCFHRSETLKVYLQTFAHENWYGAYLQFCGYIMHRYFYEKWIGLPVLDKLTQELDSQGFPHLSTIIEHFDAYKEECLSKKANFDVLLEQGGPVDYLAIFEGFGAYLAMQKRWDQLLFYLSQDKDISKIAEHLFLDKIPIPGWSMTRHGNLEINSILLLQAILRLDGSEGAPCNIPTKFLAELKRLAEAILSSYYLFSSRFDNRETGHIRLHIERMQVGESFALRACSDNHATALVIKKNRG